MSVFRYRHLFVCLVLVAVLLSCTVMASAEFVGVDSDNLANLLERTDNIYFYLMNSLGGTNGIQKYLLDIRTTVNGVYGIEAIYNQLKNLNTTIGSINSTANTIAERILTTNSNLSSILTKNTSMDKTLSDNLPDINTSTANIDTSTAGILTFLQDLNGMNWIMNASSEYSWFGMTGMGVKQLADFFCDDNSLSLKESSSSAEAVVENFYRTDGYSSISNNARFSFDFLGGLRDFFSLPDVDISSTFEQVESGYSSWFSADTAQALSVGAGAAAMTGISLMGEEEYLEPDTPYLDAWNAEVQEILAGGDGEW